MQKGIYHFWGNLPKLYELSCLATFMGKEEKLRRRAVHKLELRPGEAVLDLACGTGLNFKYLQESIGRKGKIIGVDYSPDMLTAAEDRVKREGWSNVELIQRDAAQLSLGYEVDGVISTLGISAIPNHREALDKAVALLIQGKKISILDAQPFSGNLTILNHLVKPLYYYGAEWDYHKNIIKDLGAIAGHLEVEWHNFGTIYIASGSKR